MAGRGPPGDDENGLFPGRDCGGRGRFTGAAVDEADEDDEDDVVGAPGPLGELGADGTGRVGASLSGDCLLS